MENILEISEDNCRAAHDILRSTGIIEKWESIAATVNIIGSLRTGLMMKHLDIDMHIYTDTLSITDSFRAMGAIAADPHITHITYTNLIDTEEQCIEWHASYKDDTSRLWKIDMIQILRGSAFDGFAERMADAITSKLTPELKETILSLKYQTPHDANIMGAQYYAAVMSGGVRTYPQLEEWLNAHSSDYLINWLP